ncbi:Retrovirus Polyprotein [Phytophthora palmivora]|uniref:Retrovirus Polyprotein n=1 Tax=Phytophthora palmivora TaxID=4796 RepID=A0A2P4X1X7_9STRA|nr:Retrovirus Polyprotein [Phytophthora palmivora]
MVSQTFWWPRMYKWVTHYVKTCETCQRVKPSDHASAPLQSLPVPADCWKSMSLDFVFGLPADDKGNTGILMFVCSDSVFRYHGLPETIVSDRDPRFTGAFWDTLFQLLGTKLTMSTADHPQTDGQTERVSRVLGDTFRSIVAEAHRSWSDQLPMVEFALNNADTALPGAANPAGRHRCSEGEARKAFSSQVSDIEPESLKTQLPSFIDNRLTLINREYSDKHSRGNFNVLKVGELVLLDSKNGPLNSVSSVGNNKLKHRFIGLFADLYIDLPKSMATHPTFYVERLQRYHDPLGPSPRTEEGQGKSSPPRNEAESSGQPKLPVSKSVNEKQAGTHTTHSKNMRVPNEMSSRKSHTHKPNRASTPGAHMRETDHAPHDLESLSFDELPSGRKPEHVGHTPV